MSRLAPSVCVLGLLVMLVGCPGGDDGLVTKPKPVVVSVVLSPDTVFMRPGDTDELAANVVAEAGASTAVDLSSSNPQVATVDANRRVTAVSLGQAYVRAVSQADATKKDSSLIIVDPCRDVTTFAIGATVNGTVSATSCRGVEETFSFTVAAVSILSATLDAPFPANFLYFGDRTGGWFAQIGTPARTSRPLVVAPGKYRVVVEAMNATQRGSFTLSVQASSLTSACLVGVSTAIRITSGPLTACEFTPQQRPAGVYRSMRFLLLPRLGANETVNVSVTANGFVPLVESSFQTTTGSTAPTQSVPTTADGTSLGVSMTAPAGGGQPTLIVTSRDPGVTGTFTIDIQGPPAGQPIQLDAAMRASARQPVGPLRETPAGTTQLKK